MSHPRAAVPPVPIVGLLLTVLCIGIAMAGCGGSDSSSAPAADTGAAGSASTGRTIAGKTEPRVEAPGVPPPTKLIVKDLELGQGPRARVGDDVTVEFVGIDWGGKTYFNTWTYPSPPVFELGGHRLRRMYYGLDLGVRGMRVGGRREVTIPTKLVDWPDAQQAPLKNNDLVFVVDLLKID